jgi:hypothetical protein
MTDVVGVEFSAPGGERLRVEWPVEALENPSPDSRAWRLDGEVDWDEVEAVRILTAALGDGRALALAAVRPASASGHGEEAVVALLVSDGAAEEVEEALLSTEYGPDELPRRLGLELYRREDPIPVRVAANVIASSTERDGGVVEARATLEVRTDGKRAVGVYETLTAG